MGEAGARGSAEPGGAVRLEREGAVARITLDRPAKLNALDSAMLAEFTHALDGLAADPSLRALVLTGAGRAFSVGADLDEVAGSGRAAFFAALQRAFAALRAVPCPVIGALNGVTAAGGLELALCCDLLIAAAHIRIGDAHAASGLVPGGGGASLLPGRVGAGRAARLLLTGDFESSETMLEWGLVQWVVPGRNLDDAAAALARRLATLNHEALRTTKALMRAALPAEALAREAEAALAHLATAGAAEGMAAFRGRRQPRFE